MYLLMLQREDYPNVLIGLFLEQATPFIREFFEKIAALNYPKERIDVYIHNTVSQAVGSEESHPVTISNLLLLFE